MLVGQVHLTCITCTQSACILGRALRREKRLLLGFAGLLTFHLRGKVRALHGLFCAVP